MTILSRVLAADVPLNVLSLKEIVKPVLSDLHRVEERLNAVAHEGEGILRASSEYVLSGGGKRLRAALVLYAASLSETGLRSRESALEISAAVELIHSATLVHDDIIDHAVLRRLKPTVNVEFGSEVAVLLGDFLYARAFGMIARVGDAKITALMAETTREMCEGEIDQLKHRFRADLPLEEYLSFIERKTAALISACAEAGARIAGLTAGEQKALAAYGLSMGVAFQIVDDLLDVVGVEKKIGKTLHTDVGNGKMTLPLILLLTELEGSEKEDLVRKLKSPAPNWRETSALVEKYRIREKTEAFANRYLDNAIAAVQVFPPAVRETLENISRFIVQRDY